MGFLDWMERSKVRSMHDDEGHGWERLGVCLYRADGRYPPATWAETPQEFGEMIPAIRSHIRKKLEVRITWGNCGRGLRAIGAVLQGLRWLWRKHGPGKRMFNPNDGEVYGAVYWPGRIAGSHPSVRS
jgi:hypothetical protein